jgi:hypothetical protein
VEDILKFPRAEEPSLDYWVYDGHSIDDIPTYRDVEPPLKDMFVLRLIRMPTNYNLLIHLAQFGALAWLFL